MSTMSRGALLCVSVLFHFSLSAQVCAGYAYPNPKQRIVTNVTIPGVPNVSDYVEHLPDDYNSSGNKKYPLFVWFHGDGETTGPYDGCRFFVNEYFMVPPVLIERDLFPLSIQDQRGANFSFIVISPHLKWMDAGNINALLDYLIQTYRVDASRIYLTGISSGANMILQYIGSSDNNAKRVAAVSPVAPCDVLSFNQASVVARNNLHVYTIKCGIDNCGDPNGANIITNLINSIKPGLAVSATLPLNGWPCHAIPHIAWDVAYNRDFRQIINGRNLNLYEWMVQYSTAAAGPLPVALESYTVQLSNGKVHVRWSTSAEDNSDHFNVERAGINQEFSSIATITAAGNSGTRKMYEWIDEHPLSNINFYRLTETDRDGREQIFAAKKILNRVNWDRYAVVSPNPFHEALSVYINVERVQRVDFTLADMSGRIVKTMNGTYNEGTAEVKFETGNLPRGIYLLKVEGEYFSEMQRVVKQ
jgi:hypothetical protein